MQIGLNKTIDCSDTWEMTVNAYKCGAMNFAGPESSDLILKGQKIPKTEQYTYLGYIMNNKWNISGTIKNNKLKIEKSFYAAYSFLSRYGVPTGLKLKLFSDDY
ncbi:hypothetical protein AYI68_g7380 [Smittium mucronatum]|uniref:Uncharacterized protein n=1 Tax=Smittium mucronatum TaxID=133383 RepID=A0A1R0GNU9_9FUNG|nr:hypothetical protein AYI68_g7380 [Smittium mucronatum]